MFIVDYVMVFNQSFKESLSISLSSLESIKKLLLFCFKLKENVSLTDL